VTLVHESSLSSSSGVGAGVGARVGGGVGTGAPVRGGVVVARCDELVVVVVTGFRVRLLMLFLAEFDDVLVPVVFGLWTGVLFWPMLALVRGDEVLVVAAAPGFGDWLVLPLCMEEPLDAGAPVVVPSLLLIAIPLVTLVLAFEARALAFAAPVLLRVALPIDLPVAMPVASPVALLVALA